MNFTSAAQELHITQPAVSQHIRYLEQFYRTRLFTRTGRKIRLTPAGEVLLSTMRTLRNDVHAIEDRMRACSGTKPALTFGVTMTIGEYAIARPLAQYLKRHPDTDVHIRYGNTSALLGYLREGKIDFALVEGYFKPDDYGTLVYQTQRYIPVCAAGHALEKPARILADLLAERLLVREQGSGTRDILERNLALRNIAVTDFAHIVEVENMHAIVNLLVQDCGIAFLYEAAVCRELAQGALREIPLEDFHMTHDFTFLWNRGSAFAQAYRAVCQELRDFGTQDAQ